MCFFYKIVLKVVVLLIQLKREHASFVFSIGCVFVLKQTGKKLIAEIKSLAATPAKVAVFWTELIDAFQPISAIVHE